MGRRTRKAECTLFTLAIATKRNLAKASIDPGRTSLLDSEDSKVVDMDRDENTMDDFLQELQNNLAHTLLTS
jgi:hypothetical protein